MIGRYRTRSERRDLICNKINTVKFTTRWWKGSGNIWELILMADTKSLLDFTSSRPHLTAGCSRHRGNRTKWMGQFLFLSLRQYITGRILSSAVIGDDIRPAYEMKRCRTLIYRLMRGNLLFYPLISYTERWSPWNNQFVKIPTLVDGGC